ncbi:hypothetical protein HUJ04_008088, partial [Dendroctonus ponderosae]
VLIIGTISHKARVPYILLYDDTNRITFEPSHKRMHAIHCIDKDEGDILCSGPSSAPKPTPVAIFKQINRHNEDGSYTYGYESAHGSFKIKTKLPTGEVKGKYGYVDDVGKVRVIAYGATKNGFAPVGEGITVPPPTLVDETTDKQGLLLPEYSGAYQQPDEQPQQAPERSQPAYSRPAPASSFEFASAPAPRPATRPAPRPAPLEYSPPKTFDPRPAPLPQSPFDYSFDFPSSSLMTRASFSSAPASPRPAFANAAPAPQQDFGGIPTRPAPLPAKPQPQQPSFAPAAPQYRPAPQPAGRPGSGGSILDQLSKDYALPHSNSAPLHHISF